MTGVKPGRPHPWEASYPEGVRWDTPIPTGTIPAFLDRIVREYADRPALEFRGSRMTYAELGRRADRLARGLIALGVLPGDAVALLLSNSPAHPIAFFAVLLLYPSPARAWGALLQGMLIPTWISAGALFFIAVNSIGGAHWTVPIRRVMEGLSGGFILTLLAFVALLPFYGELQDSGRVWWLWTCLAGFGLGLFGVEYCRRCRLARTDS